jgi:hypothetical protein
MMKIVHSGLTVHVIVDRDHEETLRRFAASSAMLKTLKALVARDEREERHDCPTLDRARAVIAEAEGEPA